MIPVEPVVMYAYTAYCQHCEWTVSDSSLRVVHAAGEDHAATHRDGGAA